MLERINFRGHRLIKAVHKTTMEITKESFVTPRGDCIVGVLSDKSACEINDKMKEIILRGCRLNFTILVENEKYSFYAFGRKDMSFESKVSIVIRRSNFVDGRTIGVNSNASAKDIPRSIVEKLRQEKEGVLFLEVC
jgi:hypothetical protein